MRSVARRHTFGIPVAGGGGGGSPIDPSLVANLLVWFKADAITGHVNNDPLASWTDSSGNGHTATQGSGSLQPIYKTSQVNSLPSVRFDGVDDYMAGTIPNTPQPFTVFAVVLNGGSRYFGGNGGGARAGYDGTPEANNYAGNVLVGGSTALGTWKYITSVFNGVSSKVRVEGAQATGDVGANGLGTSFELGSEGDHAGQFWAGDVAELVVYSAVVANSDITGVEAYFAAKYAL